MWFDCFGIQILHPASFKATSLGPFLACLHAKCVWTEVLRCTEPWKALVCSISQSLRW